MFPVRVVFPWRGIGRDSENDTCVCHKEGFNEALYQGSTKHNTRYPANKPQEAYYTTLGTKIGESQSEYKWVCGRARGVKETQTGER